MAYAKRQATKVAKAEKELNERLAAQRGCLDGLAADLAGWSEKLSKV